MKSSLNPIRHEKKAASFRCSREGCLVSFLLLGIQISHGKIHWNLWPKEPTSELPWPQELPKFELPWHIFQVNVQVIACSFFEHSFGEHLPGLSRLKSGPSQKFGRFLLGCDVFQLTGPIHRKSNPCRDRFLIRGWPWSSQGHESWRKRIN